MSFTSRKKKELKLNDAKMSFLNPDYCLAKTFKKTSDETLPGRNVFTHTVIVGNVAQALIDQMPEWLREAFYPSGCALVAACHDIGKISPTFQRKIYCNISKVPNGIWQILKDETLDESVWGGHAGVSQVTLEQVNAGRFIAEVAGQHHGWSPNVGAKQASDEIFGGEAWLTQRTELIEALKLALNQDFPTIQNPLQAKLISGLTTVADWIGSGQLFDNPAEEWQTKIEQAISEAGFSAPKIKENLSFSQIFGFHPREMQNQLFELVDQPGVYVLEAPMGLGKTEAALYAAYRLLEQKKATGIYFALPTQLTSEKIHERVESFLKKILEENSLHSAPVLLHGKAWLKQHMGEDAAPGGAWFSQGKKGILAPFAVGTIDQALMAVLHVKHGFVRTFGLAGKVVILDEVHTYDAYTGTIMDELVDALRQLHCTVIILSATLTQDRRQSLLKSPVKSDAYPLISGRLSQESKLEEIAIAPSAPQTIAIEIKSDTDYAFEEALNRADQGQQVLWIENTVAEAQSIFLTFSARASSLDIETGLLHSRFTQSHRQSNEEKWVTLFGKAGWYQRASKGRILVGTQVLEQSLDIDADFLVTRLAPADMILQRLGRLWRHENPHRNRFARQEAWLLSPDLNLAIENPNKHFGNSAHVYAPYVLCRTLEVWQNLTQITLPRDIRPLIEATYQDRNETGKLADYLHDIKKNRESLHSLALQGLSAIGRGKPDDIVKTRYSEQETTEVLVLKKIEYNQVVKDQVGTWLTLSNDKRIFYPHNGRALGHKEWRELAAKLQLSLVKVADYAAPMEVLQTSIKYLKDYVYLGNPQEDKAQIRVTLVRDDDQLTALDGGAKINDAYALYYSDWIGYQHQKIQS